MKIGEWMQWRRDFDSHVMEDDEELMLMVLGVNGEAGEIAEVVKKSMFHPHREIDCDWELQLEIGDLLYYILRYADYRGWKVGDLLAYNKSKLVERYPRGFPRD